MDCDDVKKQHPMLHWVRKSKKPNRSKKRSAKKMKYKEENAYPTSIFIRQEMAIAFSCIKCQSVPRKSMNTEDGNLLCANCAQGFDAKTLETKNIQNMINNLQVTCINNCGREGSIYNCGREEGGSGNINNSNKCGWKGKLNAWDMHNERECYYALISCDYCSRHSCIRKLMPAHLNSDCSHMVVDCPLKCGQTMKRFEQEKHVRKVCPECLLPCENNGCNLEIKRQALWAHVHSECDRRTVYCPFSKFGCVVNGSGSLQFCELKQHLVDCQAEHLEVKLDFVMNQVYKLVSSQVSVKKENESLSERIFQMQKNEEVQEQRIYALEQSAHSETGKLQKLQLKYETEKMNQEQKIKDCQQKFSRLESSQIALKKENKTLSQRIGQMQKHEKVQRQRISALAQSAKSETVKYKNEKNNQEQKIKDCQRMMSGMERRRRDAERERLEMKNDFVETMEAMMNENMEMEVRLQLGILENQRLEIAVYKSTSKRSFIQWNMTKIEPTTKGMIRFTNERKDEIEILKPGLYQVFYRYCAETNGGYSSRGGRGYIYLAPKQISNADANYAINTNANAYGYGYAYNDPRKRYPRIGCSGQQCNAFGSILEVLYLERNARIGCYCNGKKGTREEYCCLIIQRLGGGNEQIK